MFYISKIKLINYRCYLKQEFNFSPKRNILVGKNAVGKTSIVEAIHTLATAKSFRSVKDIDLINKGNNFYNVKGDFVLDDETSNIMVGYDSIDKRITKNSYVYKNISDFVGFINIVLFSPDDLDLVKGSPGGRRRFLDQNISQISKGYLTSLIKYKKILKERNEFIKSSDYKNYNKELLSVITEALINEASIIINLRDSFINELNPYLKSISEELSEGSEFVQAVYKPNCIVDNLWKTSQERLSYDFLMKTTTWGPTRDDINFLVNDQEAAIFCSQGQIRTVSLGAKLSLAQIFKQKNEKTIVILDDVLSEFDKTRQERVLKILDKDIQTLITTTSIENLNEEIVGDSNIIVIERGNSNE